MNDRCLSIGLRPGGQGSIYPRVVQRPDPHQSAGFQLFEFPYDLIARSTKRRDVAFNCRVRDRPVPACSPAGNERADFSAYRVAIRSAVSGANDWKGLDSCAEISLPVSAKASTASGLSEPGADPARGSGLIVFQRHHQHGTLRDFAQIGRRRADRFALQPALPVLADDDEISITFRCEPGNLF